MRAVDPAGHSYHAQSSYYVVGPPQIFLGTPGDGASYLVGSSHGFDSPVDATGAIADAKAGEPVPLKFSLGGDRGLGVVTSVTWQTASCADWTPGSPQAAAGQLSYSAPSGRYTDAVSTSKSWKGSCRILVLELGDGTQHPVRVAFTH